MTRTVAETFNLTHAKRLASKVTADMRRCQQLYGWPSDPEINDYGTELSMLMRDGYVKTYEFGYKTGESRVVSWFYEVTESGIQGGADDRPGKVYDKADISAAITFNFMTRTSKWHSKTSDERAAIESTLPFSRTSGSAPRDGAGYWINDLTYSSAGMQMARKTFRPF